MDEVLFHCILKVEIFLGTFLKLQIFCNRGACMSVSSVSLGMIKIFLEKYFIKEKNTKIKKKDILNENTHISFLSTIPKETIL